MTCTFLLTTMPWCENSNDCVIQVVNTTKVFSLRKTVVSVCGFKLTSEVYSRPQSGTIEIIFGFMHILAYDNMMQLGPDRVIQTSVTIFTHVKMAGKKEMART